MRGFMRSGVVQDVTREPPASRKLASGLIAGQRRGAAAAVQECYGDSVSAGVATVVQLYRTTVAVRNAGDMSDLPMPLS